MKINKAERKNWFFSYDAIFDYDISIHAKILYVYLCRCADSDAHSFPSKENIIKKCSMGRTSAGKALRELEAKRLIIRTSRFNKYNCQISNDYVIFPEPYKDGDE